MKIETNNPEKRSPMKSKEILMAKLSKKFPGRIFDNDDDFMDSLAEYESGLNDNYEKISNDQSKLARIFISNPKMGAFISDVVGGEDTLLSCVRHFGKDVLECAGDEGRMEEIRRENDAFLSRMSRQKELEKEIEENLQHSQRSVERFKQARKMDDEDFEMFMDKVRHICEHVFMGDLTLDVLELLFKGINYDSDLSCAEKTGEVKGRNEKIMLEKRQYTGDAIPDLKNRPSSAIDEDENLTPGFGLKRRRSVWDM